MSIRYINGSDYPRFIIRNGSTVVETIDLNLTNKAGLIETPQSFTVKKTNIYGVDREIPRKFKITFTLNYDEYFTKDDALKVQRIFNYHESGFTVILVPRTDVQGRTFEVFYGGEPFSIGILTGGESAPGNRLPVLTWVTKKLESLQWKDPEDINRVLTEFATI